MITSLWCAARSPNIVLLRRGAFSLVSDIAEFAARDCSPGRRKNGLMTKVHESALALDSGADLLLVCGFKMHSAMPGSGGRIRGKPAKL